MKWLLSPGHGKNRQGKRSPSVPPGILEWEFTRDITKRILKLAPDYGLDVIDLIDGSEHSVPLATRVKTADDLYRELKEPMALVAIHANGIGKDGMWKNGTVGSVIFTAMRCSENSTFLAKLYATAISEAMETRNRGVKNHLVNPKGKKYDHYICRRPNMPAVLVEHGFMTDIAEARKLASPYYRQRCAVAHINVMLEYERYYGHR